MIKNYLKIAYRNLFKNKVFSLINILGLAIGMAACLLILRYVQFEMSYDEQVANQERIYRLISHDEVANSAYALTSLLVAPLLENELPEVALATRFFTQGGTISIEDTSGNVAFKEDKLVYADAHFLKIFDYPVKYGNSERALQMPNSVVITVSAAKRLFGKSDEHIVGKEMTLYNMFGEQNYRVTAVLEDLPPNSHLQQDIFFSFHVLESEAVKAWGIEGWGAFPTYTLLQPQASVGVLESKLAQLAQKIGNADSQTSYSLQPLKDVYLNEIGAGNALGPTGNSQQIYLFTFLAYLILFIGWINYVNLTTARSSERIKEVGLKKILGGSRPTLIKQFLTEASLLNLLSLMLALTIFQLSLPFLSRLLDKDLGSSFVWQHIPYFPLMVLVLLIGTFLSGLYPALFLSSFAPTSVLKGKFSTSTKGKMLRRSLVAVQFAASLFLLGGTFANYLQLQFMQDADLGLSTEQVLVLEGPSVGDDLSEGRLNSIKNELLSLPFVTSITASGSIPGKGYNYYTLAQQQKKNWKDADSYAIVEVDALFVPNYQIPLLAGRNFSDEWHTEKNRIIINKTSMLRLGFTLPEQAVDQQIRTGNTSDLQQIIGVVDDYHHTSLKDDYAPIIFNYQPQGRMLSLKLDQASPFSVSEKVKQVSSLFLSLAPGNPLTYFFLDEHYDSLYRAEAKEGLLFIIFSLLAVLITCMGVYGLTSFTVGQKTKEISIRKVLGASVSSILMLLSQGFVQLVLIASVLAIPLTYWAIERWLENYAFRIDIHWWMFLLPLIVVLAIALLTISFQTIRAALANPADSLKYE